MARRFIASLGVVVASGCGGGANPSSGADAAVGHSDGNPGHLTNLPVDCRRGMHAEDPRCGGAPLGTGPSLQDTNVPWSGYYDASSDSFVVASTSLVFRIDRATGNRTPIVGMVGSTTVGGTPSLGPLISVTLGLDGKPYVFAGGGVYSLNATTGAHTNVWNVTGVPSQNVVTGQAGFAVGPDGSIYVCLEKTSVGTTEGGIGILKIHGGTVTVASLSGASDASRNVGNGVSYDGGFFKWITYANNKLYVLVPDNDLTSIDPSTGDRTIVSSLSSGVGSGDAQVWTETMWVSTNQAFTLGSFEDEPRSTAVDLGSGARTEIDMVTASSTPDPLYGGPIYFDASHGWLYLTTGELTQYPVASALSSAPPGSLYVVELATGNFNVVSN